MEKWWIKPGLQGIKFDDTISEVVSLPLGKEIITGLPPCLICGHILDKDFNGNWWCEECGTVWTSPELIESLTAEEALIAQVSIRRLED